MYWCLKEQGTC